MAETLESEYFFALNIGGPAHTSVLGEVFAADPNADQASLLETVGGTQDDTVFRSYFEGEQNYAFDVPNGKYALTLLFAEPYVTSRGARVFDIEVEGQVVSADFDIIRQRDGVPGRALTRTVPSVLVTDGELNLHLIPKIGEPVLSGLVIRAVSKSEFCGAVVYEDHFDKAKLDTQHWNYNFWPAGKVNNELQTYVDAPKNVRIEEGKLIIEAHKEAGTDQYTSGRIHTSGKVDLLYGRVEVRAKLPRGKGTWPAIWMLPTDAFKYASTCSQDADWQGNSGCDAWPNSGEIDIMEYVGYDPQRVHATVHTKDFYWVKGTQRKGSVELPTANTQFHTYALEWTPTRMDFMVDDVPYFSYVKNDPRWQAWPFDHQFHLILNLAVGGGWGGAEGPPDESAFPAQFQIDYVRIFDNKCNN